MDTQSFENKNTQPPESRRSPIEGSGLKGFEHEPKREVREATAEEKIVAEEIRKELDLMEADDKLKQEASEKANKIRVMAEDEKLKELLNIAKEKGLVYAVKVAKSMNEPYILDLFHDILAREGFFKNFIKD